jgi:methionyl-tRNA synthetase
MTAMQIVTAAPPTPNGDLHLGHLSGPYSGADVFTRAARLRGRAACYVTGSDVHQSYVPTKARRLGEEPLDMAQRFADDIAAVFATIGFATDSYVLPQHTPEHTEIVQEFVAALYQRGELERRTEPGLYCATCDRYLFEAHVGGDCPRCGVDSDGNSCENCAWPNVVTDLVNPRCHGCGASPERRDFERLYFPLSRYAERLSAYHRDAILSPQLETLCLDVLDRGLPDIPVSHPTDWGIPVPVPGFEQQRIYVWVEMLPGYFASLDRAPVSVTDAAIDASADTPRGWRATWSDPGSQVTQFFGFDNGYFHALLFPALMMAYDPGLPLPHALLTNEFYLLDNAKFSTSRGHAIWAGELLAHAEPDTVRFVLAYDRPESRRTDFTWDRFRFLVDGELAGAWQGWLGALFGRLADQYGGVVPTREPVTGSQRRFLARLEHLAGDCLAAYEADGFSPQTAARTLCELVRSATAFADGHERLRTFQPASAEAEAATALEVAAARSLALLASPLMPTFAERLWAALGGESPLRWTGVQPAPPGTRILADHADRANHSEPADRPPVFFAPFDTKAVG